MKKDNLKLTMLGCKAAVKGCYLKKEVSASKEEVMDKVFLF